MIALLALFACRGDKDVVDDTGTSGTDDTSVTDTDTAIEEVCDAKPSQLWPEDEADDHYIRDPMEILFTKAAADAAFTLALADGTDVEVRWEWNSSNELATLFAELTADTVYVWGIDVCGEHYESRFQTSTWGSPLEDEASALVGRTYVVELGDVNFTEPADLGSLLALYLDVPILLGVSDMTEDGSEMALLGAQGFVDGQGVYRQRKRRQDENGDRWTVPTWDFNAIDFTGQPYFSGDTERIELLYSGEKIPVHEFHLEGTISADGSTFGEGRLWGLADTRNLGKVIDDQADDPQRVVCDLVESAGIECVPCPDDGEAYCLFLRGEDIEAAPVPDLVLERIETEEPTE